MKESILFIAIIAISIIITKAQSPEKISYQAVIRNSDNELMINNSVGIQISILETMEDGTPVYTERHFPQTNHNGLVTLEIGTGTIITGSFLTISWAESIYFLKTEIDVEAGFNYTISQTTQLLSVPYALHANTASSLTGELPETDPVFESSAASVISSANLTNWNNAFSWGNHASAGYLSSFSETDPLWTASPSFGITNTNITNWNTAFGWGNHTLAGYLTSFSESDPTWSGSANLTGNITRTGRVGIGTASPNAGLHIKGSTHPGSFLYLQSDDEQDSGFRIYEGDTVRWHLFNESVAGGLSIRNNKYRSAIFVKQANAYAGIGTTTPEAQLHTTGSVRFAGAGTPGTGKVLTSDANGTATWQSGIQTYQIGDFAHGGIVFWVDATGQHGLVCAKTDQSPGERWYAGTNGITRAYGNGPLSGQANTSIIIAAQLAIGDDGFNYAANICNELQITEGAKTYGDWYLPSKHELSLMYDNRIAINISAIARGGSGFASAFYWSSSESNSLNAWIQRFNDGYQSGNGLKSSSNRVRAVRAF